VNVGFPDLALQTAVAGCANNNDADLIIAINLTVGAASRRDSRRGSFRVLLTPLTYIHVGDGAPTGLSQKLTCGAFQNVGLAAVGRLFYPVRHEWSDGMTDETVPKTVATAQITGARDYQEDSLTVQTLAAAGHADELLLVLADGMGGHVGGEVASRQVVEHFCAAYINNPDSKSPGNIPDALRSSLNIANEALANTVADRPKLRGMGTTLIGCVIREDQLYWISVGDSPLWVCRDGIVQRLNADHSMVPLLDEMVRTGVLGREEALTDGRRNMLRSAVAGKLLELVDLCEQPWRLQTGDLVVLASDGVETLDGDELLAVLNNPDGRSVQELAGDLMASIEATGHSGQDNASVILYRPGPEMVRPDQAS
jgi:serine/threonine protein phosphatase PrpC